LIYLLLRFSDWVLEETLQRFRGQAKASTMRDFIVRTLGWEATKSNETDGSDQRNVISFRQSSSEHARAQVINNDATKCISSTFFNKMPDYKGASVIFMDIPKVTTPLLNWSCQ